MADVAADPTITTGAKAAQRLEKALSEWEKSGRP